VTARLLGLRVRILHGCLCLVSVLCCQVDVSATGQSPVQGSSTECGVSECDREASIVRRPSNPGHYSPLEAVAKKKKKFLTYPCGDRYKVLFY